MRRFFKIFFSILASIILLIAISLGGLWLKYRSIVDKTTQQIPESISKNYPLSAQVNPFIGTGGVPWTCAYNFPGPSLPFGVVRLGPETANWLTNETGLNTSGYFYGDTKVIGFSHTRLVGTGATDGGHFLVLPINEKDIKNDPKQNYYHFSHGNEMAYPGYYALELPDERIKVELTSTERVGVHRYSFSEVENPALFFDITHTIGDNKRSEDGYVHIRSSNEIEGHARTFGSFASRYGGIKVYFAARFSESFNTHEIWTSDTAKTKGNSGNGDKLYASFTFNPGQSPIELKLAISHVSIENAWENMDAEAGGNDFDTIADQAISIWENRLKSIKLTGGTEEERINFYTALYRSFQMPTIFNDVNGQYFGFDKAVHQADSFQYFTDMSIWDTFRTAHPLYNLIASKDQHDMVVSLVQMAKEGGWLPRWPSGNGYTNSMLGSASDIVISEAYQKGICDFDVGFAYDNMKKIALASTPKGAAFSGRRGNDDCVTYGYCPADSMDQAVSRTLEYAWSDYAIGLLANELGYKEDTEMFYNLSMNYKNVWNPETQYFHPRDADGSFVKDFKPLLLTYVDSHEKYTNDYVEGSALQWRWAPFFDGPGLISLFENEDYFTSELNNFFENSDPEIAYFYPGSYYWHGNEPDIHSPYLFNYVNRPDLTQKWTRWVIDNKYKNRYDGLDGNDDGATLSAWYIFSTLGFYPIAGTDLYQLGAPLFEQAEINLGSGILRVIAENYAPDHMYVNQVWLNDTLLDRTWIKHEEIMLGGTLTFEMIKDTKINNN